LSSGPATPAEQGPAKPSTFGFGGIALVCALLQIRYYMRLDADRLEVIKLLSSSIMPLGILTVVVLAVILFGITTATESAGVGAAGAFHWPSGGHARLEAHQGAVFLTAKTTAMCAGCSSDRRCSPACSRSSAVRAGRAMGAVAQHDAISS